MSEPLKPNRDPKGLALFCGQFFGQFILVLLAFTSSLKDRMNRIIVFGTALMVGLTYFFLLDQALFLAQGLSVGLNLFPK